MKTDKNSRTHSTTSGTPSHPEQTVPDNNYTQVAPQLGANRAIKETPYDYWQDPFALFELERFNFVAGVILLLVAMWWTGCELFTVRPEIHQALERLESNHK